MPALAERGRRPRPDDPGVLQRIERAAALGHPIQTAGRMAGLGHTTAWDWHRKGLAMLNDNPEVDPRELGSHAVFADAFESGSAEMVDRKLAVINAATEEAPSKAWLPAMTLLERRRPQDFGRRDRAETSVTNIGTVNVLSVGDSNLEAAERVLARLAGRVVLPQLSSPEGEGDTAIDVSSSPADAT